MLVGNKLKLKHVFLEGWSTCLDLEFISTRWIRRCIPIIVRDWNIFVPSVTWSLYTVLDGFYNYLSEIHIYQPSLKLEARLFLSSFRNTASDMKAASRTSLADAINAWLYDSISRANSPHLAVSGHFNSPYRRHFLTYEMYFTKQSSANLDHK